MFFYLITFLVFNHPFIPNVGFSKRKRQQNPKDFDKLQLPFFNKNIIAVWPKEILAYAMKGQYNRYDY